MAAICRDLERIPTVHDGSNCLPILCRGRWAGRPSFRLHRHRYSAILQSRGWANSDADTNSDTDDNTSSDANPHTNSDTNSDADAHTNADTDTDTNADADGNADAYTNADANTD